MKRFGKTEHIYERICLDETIEAAMRHSLIKHKYPNMEVADYTPAQKYMLAHWDECKELVKRSLIDETYNFSRLNEFEVNEKKRRKIHCPKHYPDKIILICVYMIVRDYFYTKFVRNTYNCIKGRGIHDAKQAIEHIMRTHPTWFQVQTDIRKFYPTLRHDIIKADLRKVFKEERLLRIFDAILDAFHEGIDENGNEIGVAIGINLSQLLAILILIPILREINEEWHLPCVAFTDDVWAAVPDKQTAHKFVEWYIERCASRGMHVKPNYRIAPMTETLRMIGYEFHVSIDGDQYTLLSKEIKTRMKRRVRQLKKANVPDDVWKQQLASQYGWCKHAACKHLMRVTFGERYELFIKQKKKKKMKTFSDVKEGEIGEFGIRRKDRVSIKDVIGQPICFDDAKIVQIKTEDDSGQEVIKEKVAVKFRKSQNNDPVGKATYFLSGSPSLKDRVIKAQPAMPFIGTIVEKYSAGGRKKYYAIQ